MTTARCCTPSSRSRAHCFARRRRPQDTRFTLEEMELLARFANQAASALDLLQRARRAHGVLTGTAEPAVLARIAAKLEQRREEEGSAAREAGLSLLRALEELL